MRDVHAVECGRLRPLQPDLPVRLPSTGSESPRSDEDVRPQRAKTPALHRIAELLTYPDGAIVARAEDDPEVLEFFAEIARVEHSGLEELYTTTFDLNPVATLEAGWHLWGEQYERGRFLAELRGLQELHGIDAGSELPDHLTVLLPTLAAVPDDDTLRANCAKAIEKILTPLEEHGNPYRHLLRAAKEMVR